MLGTFIDFAYFSSYLQTKNQKFVKSILETPHEDQ